MKKTIICILFLFLISCTNAKNIENNNTNITTKKDLENISSYIETENLDNETKLEKVSNDIFNNYKTLGVQNQSQIECEGIIGFRNDMSEKELKTRSDFIKNCNDLKQKAQEKLQKEISNFTISKCSEKIMSLNKDNKDIPKEYINAQIETCEMKVALDKGCKILKDETKIKKCNDLKDFKDKYFKILEINEFELGNYIN